MPARLPFGLAWVPFLVAVVGCSALLDLPAPQLAQDSGVGTGTIEASVDVGAGDEPGGDDSTAQAGPDAALLDARFPEAAGDVALDRWTADVASSDVVTAVDAPSTGVLCGFGGEHCGLGSVTPSCCETANDAGMPVLTCVTSETACGSGYFIECANDGDCQNSKICCHYNSAMRCEDPTSGTGGCPGTGPDLTQACDPRNMSECPGSQMCTLHLINNNLPSPYLGCE